MVSASSAQAETPRDEAAHGAGRRRTREPIIALLAVLSGLTAVSPLAIDMYVPGFPGIATSLHASDSAVQLTMTAFLAGLVLGQLLLGPVSDSLGRRGLLIAGSAGFALFSIVCTFAPSIELLTVSRFLQGTAGAAGMVLARAVLTDRFSDAALPRYFTVLAQIVAIAPVAAPVLGGAVLAVADWRWVFVCLAAFGVLLTLAVLRWVPESLPPERRSRVGVRSTFRAMGRLLRARAFMGHVLVLGLTSAALFTYISGSSFVFQDIHGFSATAYSLIFATNAVGMLLGGTLFGGLSRSFEVTALLTTAVAVAGLGALTQLVLVCLFGETVAGTWITLCVTVGAIGMGFPATMTLAQTLGRDAPGAASALLGGMQFFFGAFASPLVGLFGTGSSLPMAAIMLVSMVAAVASLVWLVRPWRKQGAISTE